MRHPWNAALSAAMLGLLALGLVPKPGVAASVVDSKHNLSAGSGNVVRAESEQATCIFCHTPHRASSAAPLWNRASSGQTYLPYDSLTLDAAVGQPTGSSKLCLSCHDGTIALGAVLSRGTDIVMQPGQEFMPAGPGLIGTDLRDDHPISFAFDGILYMDDGQLKHPSTLAGDVKLDATGQVQCRSCHDPHDNRFGKFLVMANTQSALCLECHNRAGWDFSSHKLSTATWNDQGTDPWPTTDELNVQDNACESCHQPHSAPSQAVLLHAAAEEDNCLPCHNGNVAVANVAADFLKAERHPVVDTTGVHQPLESLSTMPRHAECVDCHNPHAARTAPSTPPNAPGALDGVNGVNSGGALVAQVAFTYEVCFKCHADSTNKPGPHSPRVIVQDNVRLEFSTGSISFHPVLGPGVSANVPSLLPPYTTSSVIGCTDCHGSDTSQSAGGAGPDGTHGSVYDPLLERRLDRPLGNVGETAAAYALCYKCHDRNSILADESFGAHSRHLGRTGCLTCHDPHGITAAQGTPTNNARLINFAADIVEPDRDGVREWVSTGLYTGNCSLRCHNRNHTASDYVGTLAGG